DEINGEALLTAARTARAIARDGRSESPRQLVRVGERTLYPALDPVDRIPNEEKVETLRRIDRLLRAADPRVKQVVVSLAGG
ncbi:metalloprotease TldD, partial [Salmonella enterica subsp. enterica serovar Typhimurium]|nr:metalloprotease TldD [Salmonella enterica subsp. enterica serovar Typhimurium]